jgi:hypothetical protein
MANIPEGGRRYNDAEVRQLLERAASLQGRGSAPVRQQGLTLAQLEEIAAEAQIDVLRLRQAARELDSGALRPVGGLERLAGAPFRVQVERELPFELDANELGRLVQLIDGHTGEAGTPSLVGRTFAWSAKPASGRRMEVRVNVQKGRTHVWIGERYGEVAGGVFGGMLGGVGGGVGIGGGVGLASTLGLPALAAVIPVAVVAGTYAACRVGYRAYVRSRVPRLEELCERIVRDLASIHDAAD